jgi:hypothetical protein
MNGSACPACGSERVLASDGGRAVCLVCTVRWSHTKPYRPVRRPVRVSPWHPSVLGRSTGKVG